MDSSPWGAAVTAEELGVRGPRGWAFRNLCVAAEPGALIAIEGPSGSGRTCALLALTGRMRPAAGRAEVAGHPLPERMAAVRRLSALAHVPGVTDLEPALTVAEHLHERVLLQRRFHGSLRGLLRPRRERAAETGQLADAALESAGLALDGLPKGARTAVGDLERLEALRLSVALALIARPRLLAVDDTDLKLSDAERGQVWTLLRDVAKQGTTVLAVCSEAPPDAVVVSTALPAGESADGAPERDTGGARGRQDRSTDGAPNRGTGGATGTAGALPAARSRTRHQDDPEGGTGDALTATGRA